MKTIATGYFNGEKVRIVSIWFSEKTGQSYCEFYYGPEGQFEMGGLRTQFENVGGLVHTPAGQ